MQAYHLPHSNCIKCRMIQIVPDANLNFKWKPAHLLTLHSLLFLPTPTTFFLLLLLIYFKVLDRYCSWENLLEVSSAFETKLFLYFPLCNNSTFCCLTLIIDKVQLPLGYAKAKKKSIPFINSIAQWDMSFSYFFPSLR